MPEFVYLDGHIGKLKLEYLDWDLEKDITLCEKKPIEKDHVLEYFNFPLIITNMTLRKYFKFIDKYSLFGFHRKMKDYVNVAHNFPETTVMSNAYLSIQKGVQVELIHYPKSIDQLYASIDGDKTTSIKTIEAQLFFSDNIYNEFVTLKRYPTKEELLELPNQYRENEYINCSIGACGLQKILDIPIVFEQDNCVLELPNFRDIEFKSDGPSSISLYNFIWGVVDSLNEFNMDPKERI